MKKTNIAAGISAALITAALSLTAASAMAADTTVYGDANCDGTVTVADATAILQYIGNPDKYELSDIGKKNADVYNRGDGLTGLDALSIMRLDAGIIEKLPESWMEGTQTETPETDAVKIHLKGTTAEVEGDYAEVKGNIITITHSGSFYVDGTLDDGQINVNIPDETADAETVKIFLNGVNITGKTAPAIYVTNAENTSINLVDGTENTVSDGDAVYAENSAVIEAKDDITIKGGENGTGVLTVSANFNGGILCNNDIKINGGDIDVTAANTTDKKDGISGKTSVTVKDGNVKVKAEGDGIKSSKGNIAVSGGTVKVKAGNDAVQASVSIDISGGKVTAGGDRGFRLDENGKLNITGGVVLATATDYQVDGNEAIDMSGVTQSTMLLDMAEEQTKDATIERGDIFEPNKKYNYALISSAKIPMVNTVNLIIGGMAAEHDGGSTVFGVANGYAKYKEVKAASGETVTPPADEPVSKDSTTLTLKGSEILSDAPSDADCAS